MKLSHSVTLLPCCAAPASQAVARNGTLQSAVGGKESERRSPPRPPPPRPLPQEYNLRKKLEHNFKAVVQDSRAISVVEPHAYAKRFLRFLNGVFVG